ncbi:MAG: ABC transporter ATP-binding protein [Eubacterium sp.]|jgi:ABC-2 type transport system ATP-binding protein|nr:ABC transporter ATP-binding protein [Eubacterium sp.]
MIEVAHIYKKYGRKEILKDINFRAKSGECVSIVGRNGCGKTTLIKILAGILKPEKGSILYYEKDPLHKKSLFHKYCGYVPQETPLIEELSVKDNLRLWGVGRSAQYERILDDFQLRDILKMRVSKMSGGMKRRLGIACALAEWPPILLLDEPTTSLDIYYKESIQAWLLEYRKMGGIVVMTTHDESEILQSDRCLVMVDGRLTELSGEDVTMQNIREFLK